MAITISNKTVKEIYFDTDQVNQIIRDDASIWARPITFSLTGNVNTGCYFWRNSSFEPSAKISKGSGDIFVAFNAETYWGDEIKIVLEPASGYVILEDELPNIDGSSDSYSYTLTHTVTEPTLFIPTRSATIATPTVTASMEKSSTSNIAYRMKYTIKNNDTVSATAYISIDDYDGLNSVYTGTATIAAGTTYIGYTSYVEDLYYGGAIKVYLSPAYPYTNSAAVTVQATTANSGSGGSSSSSTADWTLGWSGSVTFNPSDAVAEMVYNGASTSTYQLTALIEDIRELSLEVSPELYIVYNCEEYVYNSSGALEDSYQIGSTTTPGALTAAHTSPIAVYEPNPANLYFTIEHQESASDITLEGTISTGDDGYIYATGITITAIYYREA